MLVAQLMTRQVVECRPDSTLAQAAQLMWDHDCGCLPVCSVDGSHRVVGMITDRDVCMSALVQGRPLPELQVGDAMSRPVIFCRPKDPLSDVETMMRAARIRRLPVVGECEELVGMIALADLAREAAAESTQPKRKVTETEVADTLAAICRPAAT